MDPLEVEAHLLLSSMFSSIRKSYRVATTERKAWIVRKCCEAEGKSESVDAAVLYLYCIIHVHTAPRVSGPCHMQLLSAMYDGYFT